MPGTRPGMTNERPSFRGAHVMREPGIQNAALSLHLDSGSGLFRPSRNDAFGKSRQLRQHSADVRTEADITRFIDTKNEGAHSFKKLKKAACKLNKQ